MRKSIIFSITLLASGCVTSGSRPLNEFLASTSSVSAAPVENYYELYRGRADSVALTGGLRFAHSESSSEKCDSYDSGRRTWGAISIASVAFSSAGGLSGVLAESDAAKGVVIGASVAVAVLGAVGAWLTNDYAESFKSDYCIGGSH